MHPAPPTDIIAAIATAPGTGAISIVRLSGPGAIELADRLYAAPHPPLAKRPAGTFTHGPVTAGDTPEVLDDALWLIFRAPHSYTGEDSIEIQCHGGPQPARRILAALLRAGARQAEPGEFSKRAFLNGKLDLTQAEAVLDLIHARSERSARLATAQLEDALGLRIRTLYDTLLAIASDIEAMLDFPDDELPQSVPQELITRLQSTSTTLQALLNTWHEGHLLREGARITIVGAPNVGKSTLLNLLAGRDRAIVSPTPGTTRDTIEESITLDGYPIQLTDTAGLRDAPCEIEQEGIRRTHHALSKADCCLCVLDASTTLTPEILQFLNTRDPQKTIVILNKIDLGQQIFPENIPTFTSLPLSLIKSDSKLQISDKIIQQLLQTSSATDSEPVAISERHKNALFIAQEEIMSSILLLKSSQEADFLLAATHSRVALDKIGQIFGKNCSDDVLNSIFLRFCVGK